MLNSLSGLNQFPRREHDHCRSLYTTVHATQSRLNGMTAMKTEGHALASALQTLLNCLKNKALIVNDWPTAEAPLNYVFTDDQRENHRTTEQRHNIRQVGNDVSSVKRPKKAAVSARLTFEKACSNLSVMGTNLLVKEYASTPIRPVFTRAAPDRPPLAREEADIALATIVRFNEQQRATALQTEEGASSFDRVTVYGLSRGVAPVQKNVFINEDTFTSIAVQQIVDAFHCERSSTLDKRILQIPTQVPPIDWGTDSELDETGVEEDGE
jgi:DNA polymerase III gamma/tau subunit